MLPIDPFECFVLHLLSSPIPEQLSEEENLIGVNETFFYIYILSMHDKRVESDGQAYGTMALCQ